MVRRRSAVARRWPWHAAASLCLCLLFTHACGAQGGGGIDERKEYNVKGAYLYSFGRYATWPATAFADEHQPFVIGVVGESLICPVLQHIQQSKKIAGRALEVRSLQAEQAAAGCHILFVGGGLAAELQQEVIRRHEHAPILLVGESPGFAQWGGVINFFVAGDGVVRFEINVEAVRRQGVSIDAKLLRIARLVSRDGEHPAAAVQAEGR